MRRKRMEVALALVATFLVATQASLQGAMTLPGEPCTRAPVSFAPFPDRLSAYVWRNWFCVPKGRLAKVVGASTEELEAFAREMGLPPQPAILPEWRRQGYITIVRRNWHLLDYDQLLETIDMDREEFAFRLKEDDFLWHKLGKVKPMCGKLKWNGVEVEKCKGARQRIAAILKEEGANDFSEEPRFAFVKELSAVQASQTLRTSQGSPFDFRLIFSYFADYADPLGDPEIGSFPEGLLQKLAAEGVNAVWMHTVLRTLAKDPKYPEFGEGSEARIAHLRKLVARCAKYGIKVYLYMNEPRSMPAEFFAKPGREELRGTPSGDGTCYALCTSQPEVRRWVRDSLKSVFSQVKGLGGIFTISMSENLTHCDSRGGKAKCPHCRGRATGDLVAEINRTMVEGMQAGDPDATALIWNWQWPKAEESAIVAKLPKRNVRLMAVSENAMPVRRGGFETVENDYSISVVGPGENALNLWRAAAAGGLGAVAKVQANCSWELSSFPYLPVMDLVAEHAHNLAKAGVNGVMLSWSVGCCPAPNLSVFRDYRKGDAGPGDVLDRLAKELYGERASGARRAWTAFSEGFREYPFHIVTAYFGPQQMGPANPLYVKHTGYPPTMVGFPYDGFYGDECFGDGAARWRGPYPEDVWIGQMRKVAEGFRRGCELMEGVTDARELGLFRAETMHFESCVDQALFVRARKRCDRAEMRRLARAERERAKAYLPLVRADSRIGYECSNHYFFIPQDLREKILCCRAIEDEG